MATLQRYAPAGIQDIDPAHIRTWPEAASQSFKAGDLVYLASGKVTLVKAAGNNLAAADRIVGMALEDATGTTDTDLQVWMFQPGMTIRLPVYHSGGAASSVTAVSGNGTAYELRNHTGSIWCVDISSTTNNKGRQLDVAKDFAVGEQYGLINYCIHANALQFYYSGVTDSIFPIS